VSNNLNCNHSWYKNLCKYIDEECKASVLTIDPTVDESQPAIKSKWSIMPVLPIDIKSTSSDRVYLCDLGFTKNMFSSVNIKYESPFGAKFVIPLHNE
jgi:hypothetical protein